MRARKLCTEVMLLVLCVALLISLGGPSLLVAFAQEPPPPPGCIGGVQPGGAHYWICMPPPEMWNGDLVVFAHGYVDARQPVSIPVGQLVLPDGTSIPELVTGLGFAFAVSSYRVNGLAIVEGQQDLVELVGIFTEKYGLPGHVYLLGASEGGLITALAVEEHADVFDGGLAVCGPVGDFRRQINYFGDVRVVFDYFFPGIIPGSAIEIPADVVDNWESVYVPAVTAALLADPHATDQLLRVTKVAVDPAHPETRIEAIVGVLAYNVLGTNDAKEKLGGQPFDNWRRWYSGSDNDRKLNRKVARYKADPAALAAIEADYQTSGDLGGPLVTMHNLHDPIVPYWHEPLYRLKIWGQEKWALHNNIPLLRYGHCNVGKLQALAAFGLLVYKVSSSDLDGLANVLPERSQQDAYHRLLQKRIESVRE
ncbi:MAG: hypothetical protein H5T69_04695 [Chloroflexi bacterium]|nr:hypothetical protein [Chloroflexota bacterium]